MTERDTQTTAGTATTTTAAPSTAAAVQSGGAATVYGMLQTGRADPVTIASVLANHPGSEATILQLLHQALGNHFVQQVLSLIGLGGSGDGGAMQVTANGLHVRSTPHTGNSDNILTTLPHHATVQATGRSGDWMQIDHHGKPAFAFGHYLAPAKVDAKPEVASHAKPEVASHAKPEVASHAKPAHAKPEVATHTHPEAATHAKPEVAPVPLPRVEPVAAAAPPSHAPDPAHVDKPAHDKPAHDKPAAHHDKKPKIEKATKFAKYGGGRVKTVLTKLANEGKVAVTGREIAQLDGLSEVETGGQVGAVDTTDDEV